MVGRAITVTIPVRADHGPVAVLVETGVDVDVLRAVDAHMPPKGSEFVSVLLDGHGVAPSRAVMPAPSG